MFRYDRPQAGRYRQFSQWDVEVIGDPGPMVDAELVELAQRFYREAGVAEVETRLNSIGDEACRPAYRDALVDYFSRHEERLSDDSRRRLRTNPLRVLDDKDLDFDLAAGAPKMAEFLCDACADHFTAVRGLLDRLGCPYLVDHRLVRGLDYYTRTAFEFYPAGRHGQQDAIGGGGRYDGLVELVGGRSTPGIGFGVGIDRTARALEVASPDAVTTQPLVVVVGADPSTLGDRLTVAGRLRDAGLRVRADGSARKLGRQLESASKHEARWAVIVGDELRGGRVVLRDLAAGEQRELGLNEVAAATRA
jgi:histidyl-tRNA synthetase